MQAATPFDRSMRPAFDCSRMSTSSAVQSAEGAGRLARWMRVSIPRTAHTKPFDFRGTRHVQRDQVGDGSIAPQCSAAVM